MRLDENEIVFFAAMLFVAGANRTAGKQVAELATINPEQFREAREIAARELPQFKARMKKRRLEKPVS